MSNPSAAWVRKLRDRLPPQLTAAAVLIPIVRRQEELTVLLTERSADLTHHAGQISFPGGRMDPEDSDICATALRETHEEVGIRAEHIEIVGYLPPNPTVTGYAVTPVVALVAPQPSLTIDPLEVRSAFEVPLSFLLDARNQRQTEREFEGIVLPLVEFIYAGHRIWGATAGMLVDFRDHLLKIE
jgi:8-oxo-dGTP pyrophosphatase MutT (NUDIX family)